jgi:nicotinate-nucleotide adenylyltransferase
MAAPESDIEPAGRIGLLGGTFDPPHLGHVIVAANVRHELGLDRLLLVPASIPWQKVHLRAISPAADRLAMVQATLAGVTGVEVSTIELDRGGESYSADTLEELTQRAPGAELFLLVGSDIAPHLDTWKRPDVVRSLATVVVYDRPGSAGHGAPAGWNAVTVPVPQVEISSTDIRARVRAGRPIDGLVTPAVARHIHERDLYRGVAAPDA